MKYSEEMRLIFKGYSKDEIAALKEAEKVEIEENKNSAGADDKGNVTPPDPKLNEEETIKKLEDYEAKITELEEKNKKLEEDLVKANNHQTLGEPVKQKDAADVMSELFKFKKKEEK